MSIETPCRIRVNLSPDWLFRKGRSGRRWLRGHGEEGERVHLPHCWNTTDTFQPGVSYYRGWGGYRRRFEIPDHSEEEGPRIWRLESEGFYGTGQVWLNGERLARVDGQYLGFRLELPPLLRRGHANLLAVTLTNRCARHVLPGHRMPDFLLYGGLAGRLWLVGLPRLHLLTQEVRVRATEIRATGSRLEVICRIRNAGEAPLPIRVQWHILDAAGRTVAETEPRDAALPGRTDSDPWRDEVAIAPVRLWSPADPHLYEARCRLSAEGRLVDEVRVRFGIRHAEFRPRQGFFLNGERIELRGCNRHESMPGFGSALPEALHRQDAALLKELGCNFVRLSHYPQHPAFLDACDEMGLMVYAELASWKSVRGGRWLQSAVRQLTELVARDRHRPCVVIWGLGNESRSRRAFRTLRKVVDEKDPDRPVSYAENHFHRAARRRVLSIPDVWGCNYELDRLADGAGASRLQNVIVTECSNQPDAERGRFEAELAQAARIEQDLARFRGLPFVAGFALWCFNDYATLRKKRYRRFSGVVDAWRTPKLSAALLRALFSERALVALAGDWSREGSRSPRDIHVFTNCEEVELWRGPVLLERVAGAPHRLARVEFKEEVLTARGRRGAETARDSLQPFGSPAAIRLSARSLGEGGPDSDLIEFHVEICDDGGRRVGTWNGEVRMRLEGRGRLHAYTPEGNVAVRGGWGRGWFSLEPGESRVRLRAEHPDVPSALLEWWTPRPEKASG